MDVSASIMEAEGVAFDFIRLADYDIPVGVQPDMAKEGESKDDWPEVYKK